MIFIYLEVGISANQDRTREVIKKANRISGSIVDLIWKNKNL